MHDATRRQLARRTAVERRSNQASRRDREITALGESVEVQLRTRDAAVRRAEQMAGEALSVLTRCHGLSMETALAHCGHVVSRAEALRLRRAYERDSAPLES